MAINKVEYKMDSTTEGFAQAGDEVTVTKSNVKTVEEDLDDDKLNNPSSIQKNLIHTWAAREGSGDKTEYETGDGDTSEALPEDGQSTDKNSLGGDKAPSDASQTVAGLGAVASTDFGAACLALAITRLATIGLPFTGVSTGVAEIIEGGISLGLAAAYDTEIYDRLGISDSVDTVMGEFDTDDGLLNSDIDTMIDFLETNEENLEEPLEEVSEAPETSEVPDVPDESDLPDATDAEVPEEIEEGLAISDEASVNNEEVVAVVEENREISDFLKQGYTFGTLATANAAMLGATAVINGAMAAKATIAAAAYHAAALAASPFGLMAYEAMAIDQEAGAAKLVTSKTLFAGAAAAMMAKAAAEIRCGERGDELGSRIGELEDVIASHDETRESFLTSIDGDSDSGDESLSSAGDAGDSGGSISASSGSSSGGSSGGSSSSSGSSSTT